MILFCNTIFIVMSAFNVTVEDITFSVYGYMYFNKKCALLFILCYELLNGVLVSAWFNCD